MNRVKLICCVFICAFSLSTMARVGVAEDSHNNHESDSEHHRHDKDDGHEKHQGHEDHHGHDEGLVKLTSEQISEFDIVIEKAGPGKFEKFVETPGVVEVNEETLSHISARFPGIVKQVTKKIGDPVKKGDALAVIESNESLTAYTIKSLIGGTVIAKHATLGELLKEDDIAYTVADLSTVWINLSIYQANIPNVKTGQTVIISQGHGQTEATGTISYISPVIDEDTRTATARVVLPNPDGSWMPGLFITARIRTEERNVPLLIPATAVHRLDDKPAVFVRSNNDFKPIAITIERQNDTHVVVNSGLQAGQEYVAKHGFALKAELSKSSFGDGHNH